MKIKVLIFLSVLIFYSSSTYAKMNFESVDSISYSIHNEKMDYIKRDVRPYLKHDKSSKNKIAELSEEQKSVELHIKTGNENLALQNYKAAVREYNLALDIEPKNTEALCNRAKTKIEMHVLSGAKDDYDQAIESDSESVELFFNRGNLKFELKEFEGAAEDYSKAILLNAKDKRIFYNRAIVEYLRGNKELACNDFQKALKLGDADASVAITELCK